VTTIDFKRAIQDAKSASFEALPVGDYDVEVVESTAVRSSNGKPMVKVQLQVLSGPFQNRRIFNNFVFSADNAMAMSIFFRHMKCFGLTEDFFAGMGTNGSMEVVANELLRKRARVTLGIRQWQGEDRNEVNQIKPYTGAPGIPNAAPAPTPTGPGTSAYPTPQAVGGSVPVAVPPPPQPVAPPQPVQTFTQNVQPSGAQPISQPVPSGLDEFRPAAVPTQAGPAAPADVSSASYPVQPTSEQQSTAAPIQAPPPPAAPELPI
jgi:hypothetical protein